jgi:hypothetical protein
MGRGSDASGLLYGDLGARVARERSFHRPSPLSVAEVFALVEAIEEAGRGAEAPELKQLAAELNERRSGEGETLDGETIVSELAGSERELAISVLDERLEAKGETTKPNRQLITNTFAALLHERLRREAGRRSA